MLALLACCWALAAEPSDHTLVYYNARMALREGAPLEATRLWLLRNALEDQTGRVSPHDADFGSVTWAALGELGVCPDGHPTDEDGAGLWPLAFHNWVVRNRSRRRRDKPPRPFEAFEVGRQQRLVSIGDVLGSAELGTVDLFRGACVRPRLVMLAAGEPLNARLSDSAVAARLLVFLLERGKETLSERVRGRAAIDARLFDLYLQLAAFAEREARQKARERGRRGKQVGLGRSSVAAMSADVGPYAFDDDSEPARILRDSVRWSVDEWMAISPERRQFLYTSAGRYGGDPAALDGVALGVIDALIDAGDGAGVQDWIGHRGMDPARQEPIWSGERGQRLLALDRDSGFRERGVVALHRGVRHLEHGDLPGALRSFAYALGAASESAAGDEVYSLSLRWLSYVASQYEVSDTLLITLQELVPRQEYGLLLEDLMWSAALRADVESFRRGQRNQLGRGALVRRIALLDPLAVGDITGFIHRIGRGLVDGPSETLRFLDQLLERLEREDADVRAAHVPTLIRVRGLVEPLVVASGRQGRTATEVLRRSQAILEGLGELGEGASARDQARSLGPSAEVFAGSVRLAPADPLPWPFRAPDVAAPSAFSPLDLVPVEWEEDGALVFGWDIEG
ncbi:MAG: hypothetical protein ACI8PZ_002261 [Myxococcota bacterium]|jgi:hypothetical protein